MHDTRHFQYLLKHLTSTISEWVESAIHGYQLEVFLKPFLTTARKCSFDTCAQLSQLHLRILQAPLRAAQAPAAFQENRLRQELFPRRSIKILCESLRILTESSKVSWVTTVMIPLSFRPGTTEWCGRSSCCTSCGSCHFCRIWGVSPSWGCVHHCTKAWMHESTVAVSEQMRWV